MLIPPPAALFPARTLWVSAEPPLPQTGLPDRPTPTFQTGLSRDALRARTVTRSPGGTTCVVFPRWNLGRGRGAVRPLLCLRAWRSAEL